MSMSIDDRNIDPNIIANYIISKDILDKKTVSQAFKEFSEKRKLDKTVSFSQILVDKRYMLKSTIKNILDQLENKKVESKSNTETNNVLDSDILDICNQIKEKIKGKNKENELAELLEADMNGINNLMKTNGIDWQGRRMTKEEKESLVTSIANIKANKDVSNTNGLFVLDWLTTLTD